MAVLFFPDVRVSAVVARRVRQGFHARAGRRPAAIAARVRRTAIAPRAEPRINAEHVVEHHGGGPAS